MDDIHVIATAVGATYVLSGIVVSFDPYHRQRLSSALVSFPYLLVPAALALGVWVFYTYGLDFLAATHCRLSQESWARSNQHALFPFLGAWLSELAFMIFRGVVTVGVLVGAPIFIVRTTVPILWAILPKLPTIVITPLIALYLIGREIFFFVTKPASIRALEQTVRTRGSDRQAMASAVAALREEVARASARTRSWRSALALRANTRHLERLTRYIDAATRATRAVNDSLGDTTDRTRRP